MKIVNLTKLTEIQEIVATTTSIEDAELALNKIQSLLTENQNEMPEIFWILNTIAQHCNNDNLQWFLLYALQKKENYDLICTMITTFHISIRQDIYDKLHEHYPISNLHILALLHASSKIIDYSFIFNRLNTEKLTSDIIVRLIRSEQYNNKMIEKFLNLRVLNENVENSIFIIESLIDKFSNYDMLLYLISCTKNAAYLKSIKLILEHTETIQERNYNKIMGYLKQLTSFQEKEAMTYILNRLSTTEYISKDTEFIIDLLLSYKIDDNLNILESLIENNVYIHKTLKVLQNTLSIEHENIVLNLLRKTSTLTTEHINMILKLKNNQIYDLLIEKGMQYKVHIPNHEILFNYALTNVTTRNFEFIARIYCNYNKEIDLFNYIVGIDSASFIIKNIDILNLFNRLMQNEFKHFNLQLAKNFIEFSDIFGLDAIQVEIHNEKQEFIFYNFIASYYINHETTKDDLKYILNLFNNNMNKTVLGLLSIKSSIYNKLNTQIVLDEQNFVQPDNLIYNEQTFNTWKQVLATFENKEKLKLCIENEIIALYKNLRTHELWFEFTLRHVFKLWKIIELCPDNMFKCQNIKIKSLTDQVKYIETIYFTYYTTKQIPCSTIELIETFIFQFTTTPWLPTNVISDNQIDFFINNHFHFNIIIPILKEQLTHDIDIWNAHAEHIFPYRKMSFQDLNEYLTHSFNLPNTIINPEVIYILEHIIPEDYNFTDLMNLFKLQLSKTDSIELKHKIIRKQIHMFCTLDTILLCKNCNVTEFYQYISTVLLKENISQYLGNLWCIPYSICILNLIALAICTVENKEFVPEIIDKMEFIKKHHLIYDDRTLVKILISQLDNNIAPFEIHKIHAKHIFPYRKMSFQDLSEYLTHYFNLPNTIINPEVIYLLGFIIPQDYDFTDLMNLFKLQLSKTDSIELKHEIIHKQIETFCRLDMIVLCKNCNVTEFYQYISTVLSKEDILEYICNLWWVMPTICVLNLIALAICTIENKEFVPEIIDEMEFIKKHHLIYDDKTLVEILISQLEKNVANFEIHAKHIFQYRNTHFTHLVTYLNYYLYLHDVRLDDEEIMSIYDKKPTFDDIMEIAKKYEKELEGI